MAARRADMRAAYPDMPERSFERFWQGVQRYAELVDSGAATFEEFQAALMESVSSTARNLTHIGEQPNAQRMVELAELAYRRSTEC